MSEKFIGKYKILKEVGRGGTARVYKVSSPDGSIFALKYLFPFPELTERWKRRFAREFTILSKLNHPHLIRVYEFEEDRENDTIYYTMDFIEGDNLWRIYRDSLRKLPLSERIPPLLIIMSQVAVALDYIHSRRVIHKDLKPANVLIDRESKNAYLADFGLAREIRESSALYTHAGFLGTLGYSAPELIQQRPFDERVDIYSWGVIFYTLLADRRPIPVEKMSLEEAINTVLNEDPPPLETVAPDVPEKLAEIVNRCLARNPADRFRTIRHLWKELIPLFSLYLLPEKPDRAQDQTPPPHQTPVGNYPDITAIDNIPAEDDFSSSSEISEQLVGRKEEISRVIEAFKALKKRGEGRFFIYYGLPGMGKSSLSQVIGQLAQNYFSAVYSWSWKPTENPMVPLIEFLRPKLLRPIPSQLAQSYAYTNLKRFLPQAFEIFSPPPSTALWRQIPAKELSKWVSHVVGELLSSKGEVWLFDDFQNLPPYAAEVLQESFRQLSSSPLVGIIFIGYTPEHSIKFPPLPNSESSYLLPLSEEEEAELLRRLTGREFPQTELAELHLHTKGIPSKVVELAAARDNANAVSLRRTLKLSDTLPSLAGRELTAENSPFQEMTKTIEEAVDSSVRRGEEREESADATVVMDSPPIELFYNKKKGGDDSKK